MSSDLLFYTNLIYCFERGIEKNDKRLGNIVIVKIKKAQINDGFLPSYIVCNNNEEVIIWYKGTNLASLKDIKIDFTFKEVEFLGGLCHKGFLYSTNKALEGIKKLINGKKYITFIGHSLGGACAAISALILHYQWGLSNVRALTIACPGFVTRDIAMMGYNIITAIVRKNDPITVIFSLKENVYKVVGTVLKKKLTPAYSIPGRIFVLAKSKVKNEYIIRYPIKGDLELYKIVWYDFFRHLINVYKKEIEFVCKKYKIDSPFDLILIKEQ